jgi:hypothetical protein
MNITLDQGAFDHIPFVELVRFLAQYNCRFERLPTNELRIIHVRDKPWILEKR